MENRRRAATGPKPETVGSIPIPPLGGDQRRDTMTTLIRDATEFADEIKALVEDKDNPDEWYVLIGSHVTDYSVNVPDAPDDYEEHQEELPPEEKDANEWADGVWQVGTLGWAGEVLDEDCGFVSEFSFQGGNVDSRLLGTLLVHESMLSEKALEEMDTDPKEVEA